MYGLERETTVRRNAGTCRGCARRTRRQIHHFLTRGQGGSDHPTNLVLLCARCHMLVSPIPVARLRAWFGVDEAELILRKARVELAICTWLLSEGAAVPPAPRRPASAAAPHRVPAPHPPAETLPEWKRLRPRAGRRWEPAEDALLLADFDAGLPLPEIAARRGRGEFSIEVRLCKLGRTRELQVRKPA